MYTGINTPRKLVYLSQFNKKPQKGFTGVLKDS